LDPRRQYCFSTFTLFLFFATQTLLENGHVMVDGTVVLEKLFHFYIISALFHADAPGERPRDGGWIRGASVAAGLDLQWHPKR
jgi:hypothetical protein